MLSRGGGVAEDAAFDPADTGTTGPDDVHDETNGRPTVDTAGFCGFRLEGLPMSDSYR